MKKILKNLSLLWAFALLISCSQKAEEVKTEVQVEHNENVVEFTEEQYKTADIVLGKVEMKNLSNVVIVNGLLDVPPQNLVSISVPLGGFLKSTVLLQGMKVKKGQLIATIENAEFITMQQDFLDTKSKLDFMEVELKRQEELSKENVSSTKVLQQAQSDYKSLKSRYSGLKEKLELIGLKPANVREDNISRVVPVYSPINGYVTNIYTNIGRFVNPVDVLFELVNTDHIHAELTVYEKDITKIKKGQKVRFTLPNENDNERTAKVFLIGREISPDRTIRVHAHLDKEDEALLPKMYIKAVIEMDAESQMAVPEKAIVNAEGKDFIFSSEGSQMEKGVKVYQFKMIEVQKGISENGYTAISASDGININDISLVKKGAYGLLSKMKNSGEDE
jgi:cobalt-zinc-cadmium efflux system membrane fusion protein